MPYSELDEGLEHAPELTQPAVRWAGARCPAHRPHRTRGPVATALDAPPAASPPPAPTTRRRRLSAFLFRSRRTRLAGLLAPPVLWLVLIYFAAVFSLLSTAFFSVDEFTNAVVHTFTTQNFVDVFTEPAYLRSALQTVGIAASVTVLCICLGLPMAFFMAKIAPATVPRVPRRAGDHAAVGVVPRQGLRLAGDGAARERRDRLAGQAVRALRPRLRRSARSS